MADTKKTVTLKTSDGEDFVVEEAVALQSGTIKHMIEDDCAGNGIPLPNVTGKIMSFVVEYCKKHVENPQGDANDAEDDLKKWNDEFVNKFDQNTLFDVILAANYLDIKSLLDLTCQAVADMITKITKKEGSAEAKIEEIRRTFNIKNDFTPKEEEELKKENQWAFE